MKKLFFAIISLLAMIVIMTPTATAQNRRRERGRDYVNDAARRSMGILHGDQRGMHRDDSILGYHVHERYERGRSAHCAYYGCDEEFFCKEELFNHMYRHRGNSWSGATASIAESFLGFLIERSRIKSEEKRAKEQIKLWREILREERGEHTEREETPVPTRRADPPTASYSAPPSRPQGKGIEIFIDPEQLKKMEEDGVIVSGVEMIILGSQGSRISSTTLEIGETFTYYPLASGPSRAIFQAVATSSDLKTVNMPLFPKLIDGRFRLVILDK